MFKVYIKSLLSVLIAFLVIGCSSDSSDSSNGGGSLTDSTITGSAIDGYLVYSTVCLDLNKNGSCQPSEEPSTSTDVNGSFSLTIEAEQKSHANYETAPLLVYGGYDADTNSKFTGKLKSTFNDESVKYITPITTMVQAMVEEGTQEADAEVSVIDMLDLPDGTDLGANPVEAAKTDPRLLRATLQLQKTMEILANSLQDANTSADINNLVEGLYTDMAFHLQNAGVDTNINAMLSAVVANNDDLDDSDKNGAIAVSEQVQSLVGTQAITNTTLIGTKISAVQNEVVDAIENNQTIDTSFVFDSTTKTFSLLHAEEILRITQIEDTNGLALAIAAVLDAASTAASIPENKFLPIDDEIIALKDSANTAAVIAVGVAFEAIVNGITDAIISDDTTSDITETLTDAISGKTISMIVDSITAGFETMVPPIGTVSSTTLSSDGTYTDNLSGIGTWSIDETNNLVIFNSSTMGIIYAVEVATMPATDVTYNVKVDTNADGTVDSTAWSGHILSVVDTTTNTTTNTTTEATNYPIIGSWTVADSVLTGLGVTTTENDYMALNLVILSNEDYYFTQGNVGDEGIAGGIEVNKYTFENNIITTSTIPYLDDANFIVPDFAYVNTNQHDTIAGPSDGTIVYNPTDDTITIQDANQNILITFTRNKVAENPAVGAWAVMGYEGSGSSSDDVIAILTLDKSGYYMVSDVDLFNPTMYEEDIGEVTNGVSNAFEMGTYVVNTNGSITFTIDASKDFNGFGGMSSGADGDLLVETLDINITGYPNINDGFLRRIQPDNVVFETPNPVAITLSDIQNKSFYYVDAFPDGTWGFGKIDFYEDTRDFYIASSFDGASITYNTPNNTTFTVVDGHIEVGTTVSFYFNDYSKANSISSSEIKINGVHRSNRLMFATEADLITFLSDLVL